MQIDRRITNGLAWAGAVLVVAIPAADFAMRQAGPSAAPPQIAMVQAEPVEDVKEAVALPTPAAQRPVVTAAQEDEPAQVAAAPVADPVGTSAARPSSGAAVDSFLQSGRELPSYISGGSNSSAAVTPSRPDTPVPTVAPQQTPAPTVAALPTAPTPAVATQTPMTAVPGPTVAAVPPKPVTLPTPVSQRPPPVAQATVRPLIVPQQQAPLIIDEAPPVLTADDLDDWESGPLSEFLASRGNRAQAEPVVEPDYDSDGFFLDEAPVEVRPQTFPRAYGEGFYYPFAD